ncbi:uncharacterized protein [Hemitrygon akajei]|uniref:uncharacterized protein isoform X1 n=2 Tax=Hemitrygon akajei TaxID=2704970 RepID=UPI003BFA0DAE
MVRLLTNGSVRKKRARSHDRPLQKAKLAMPKNVEIKAAVHDWNRLVENAKRLSKSEGILIMQEDTFFNVSKGRLKLRNLKNEDGGQLIFYNRADMDGPKLSDYSIYPTGNPDALTKLLSDALGIKGFVKKERWLYMVGQTRVHADLVEGLGQFVELEVVLREDQSLEEGEAIAQKLMGKLGIKKEDLVTGAYMDLLLADQ